MQYLALREVQETRTLPAWDGSEIKEVKDAKIVERFVEKTPTDLSYHLTAVLLKIKAKGGGAFYAVAELDVDPDGSSWVVGFPENLIILEEEDMVAQDYINYALRKLDTGSNDVRIVYKHESELTEEQ